MISSASRDVRLSDHVIQLSNAAIAEIKRLHCQQPSLDSHFRLSIQEGGCFGSLYDLRFDPEVRADDQRYAAADVDVIVSNHVLPFVQGLQIDYSEDLMGGGFRFHNPNATRSCSCGNSFSIQANDLTELNQADCLE
jgi:iron-sulfur cluster assembly accessory protein